MFRGRGVERGRSRESRSFRAPPQSDAGRFISANSATEASSASS